MDYTCSCGRQFRTIQAFSSHKWRAHTEKGKKHRPTPLGKPSWSKGLTKETHPSIARGALKNSTSQKGISLGRKLSESTKCKLSESMKRAHAEGRAWNIGKSRWHNKPSYPESFFIRVIENEFHDKKYVREFPFGKFSLDFAWVEKKLAIEIDGAQHDRFDEQKRRDKEKDQLAIDGGWKILRLKWKEIYGDTKSKIREAVDFIGE